MISIVTPAFNESTNLDRLYGRLAAALASLQLEWEWLIVDDHSRDDTFSVIERLAAADPRAVSSCIASVVRQVLIAGPYRIHSFRRTDCRRVG